jgi:hypothetical protein
MANAHEESTLDAHAAELAEKCFPADAIKSFAVVDKAGKCTLPLFLYILFNYGVKCKFVVIALSSPSKS